MEMLTIYASSPATGRAMLAALSAFRAEMLEDGDGSCEIAVRLGSDSEVVAVLTALERYVTERANGPARMDFKGHSYVMHAGPGDLTE